MQNIYTWIYCNYIIIAKLGLIYFIYIYPLRAFSSQYYLPKLNQPSVVWWEPRYDRLYGFILNQPSVVWWEPRQDRLYGFKLNQPSVVWWEPRQDRLYGFILTFCCMMGAASGPAVWLYTDLLLYDGSRVRTGCMALYWTNLLLYDGSRVRTGCMALNWTNLLLYDGTASGPAVWL